MMRHPCGRVCGPDLFLLPFLVPLALARMALAAWQIRSQTPPSACPATPARRLGSRDWYGQAAGRRNGNQQAAIMQALVEQTQIEAHTGAEQGRNETHGQ